MPGAAHALHRRGDGPGRTYLADQVDAADIDAQLQRGRGDQQPDLAVLELALRFEPQFPREAAMVRGYILLHPSRSPRQKANRSTIRRVLTKTSVDRCCKANSARRS